MHDLGRLARWFGLRVRTGHVVLRIFWGFVAFFVLIYAFLGAVAYEVVRFVDRKRRLSAKAHWGVAIGGLVLLIAISGALNEREPVAAGADEVASPTMMAATTPTASPTTTSSPTPRETPAPPFEVRSPADGETVTQAEIAVEGVAPPGGRIVQDISFAPDQETTADAEGEWTITVRLDPGTNRLRFRLDEDRSTEQDLVVTYVESTPSPKATLRPTPTPRPATPRPTPTPDPWPRDFKIFVCDAVREIDDAGGHLAEAGGAAEDFDIERMIEESEKAAQDASEARNYLSLAPRWAPGQNVVNALTRTAQLTLEAANLLKLGGQTLNPTIIDEAGVKMKAALDAKIDASVGLVELQEATGFDCS